MEAYKEEYNVGSVVGQMIVFDWRTIEYLAQTGQMSRRAAMNAIDTIPFPEESSRIAIKRRITANMTNSRRSTLRRR